MSFSSWVGHMFYVRQLVQTYPKPAKRLSSGILLNGIPASTPKNDPKREGAPHSPTVQVNQSRAVDGLTSDGWTHQVQLGTFVTW